MRHVLVILAGVLLGAAPEAALAKTKSFSLTAKDMYGTNGAVIEPFGGYWVLSSSGNPGVSVNFTLPNDYKKNSRIIVRVGLSNVEDCAISFDASTIRRFRPGLPLLSTSGPGSGFAKIGGSVEAAPSSNIGFNTEFELKPATNNSVFTTHKPGDVINLTFSRYASEPEDTCAPALNMIRAKVIYKTPD